MKKFFYLMSLCLCMFMGASVLTSCGDDDDDKVAINMATLKEEGVVENGNTLQKTIVDEDYATILTATFDNDGKCNSFIIQYVFPSAAYAQLYWAANQDDEEYKDEPENWSITSNVITYNCTEYYKGRTKRDIKEALENNFD